MEKLIIRRALLSVTDKTDLAQFASFLHEQGVEIVSTGGTYKHLCDHGLPVTPVSEVTQFPEILGGRVKTLNPRIHGGILADKDKPDHLETLAAHKIMPFDLVCVNLYEFSKALEKNLDPLAMIEEIDIGGPCLLRASAKNFNSVLVLPDPSYYPCAKEQIARGHVDLDLRIRMAALAFQITSNYDAMIHNWLQTQL